MNKISSLLLLFLSSTLMHADESHLKVMSYNIRYGTANDGDNHWNKRKDFLRDTIKTYDPELLGTQETLSFQKEYLEKELKDYTSFGAGRDDGKLTGEMAALFFRRDRFDQLDGGHFWLSTTPDNVGSRGWDAALPRIATWVKLNDKRTPGSRPLLFLNTHFDHKGKVARRQSATLIRQQLTVLGKGCDIIVTGDFNAGEGSEPYQALFADIEGKPSIVVDVFRKANPQRGRHEGTFNGFQIDNFQGERIDWIGCSSNFRVISAEIDHTVRNGKVASDHFAVRSRLERKTDSAAR